MFTVVTGDGSVGSLGLHDLSVGGDQLRGHESERSESLRDNVTLNVSIVWERTGIGQKGAKHGEAKATNSS